MSNAHDSLSASDTQPPPDYAAALIAQTDGEPAADGAMDYRADDSGHTLLSRSPAPEGRRSLFRR